MPTIDPLHPSHQGGWRPRPHPDRGDRRPFTLPPEDGAVPDERPLLEHLPAPLTALPSLLEPAAPVDPDGPYRLHIAFYGEHQPVCAPEPVRGGHLDARA